MNAKPADDSYWDRMPADERERLDAIAQSSILELACWPRDHQLRQELCAWQQLEIDIAEAHGKWLERARSVVQSRGRPWTTAEVHRYAEESEGRRP